MLLKKLVPIFLVMLLAVGALSVSAQTPPIFQVSNAQTDDCYYLEDLDVELCYDEEYDEWYADSEFADDSWGDACFDLEDDLAVCYDAEWDWWYEDGEWTEEEDCYYLEDRDVNLCYFAEYDEWYDDADEIDDSWVDECYDLDDVTVCYDSAEDWWYEEGQTVPVDDDISDDWGDDSFEGNDEIDAAYFVGVNLVLEGDVDPTHQAIWDIFISLIPTERLDGVVVSYEVFSSDDGTVAYVYNIDENLVEWVFAYNIDEATNYPEEIISTLVHEYGHILSLEADQMSEDDEDSCATYFTGEGCLAADSYLAAFYNEFWPGTETDAEGEGRASDYVSDYAQSNVVEDFAESFMTFVMSDERPSGNTGADRKVKFFYNYPDLVSLRDTLRGNMQ